MVLIATQNRTTDRQHWHIATCSQRLSCRKNCRSDKVNEVFNSLTTSTFTVSTGFFLTGHAQATTLGIDGRNLSRDVLSVTVTATRL
jgi:hypothetical protein